MSTSDLRDLLADATRSVPAATLRPPLSSIHDGIRRRRARRVTAAAAALVIATAVGVVSLVGRGGSAPVLSPPPTPSAVARSAISWHLAYLNGDRLTIYVTDPLVCINADSPQTTMEGTDRTVTITLTGLQRTGARCDAIDIPAMQFDNPDRRVTLIDGATGQTRPVYRRTDLPVHGKNPANKLVFIHIAAIDDQQMFQAQYTVDSDTATVAVRGIGQSTGPAIGEPWSAGSIKGTIVNSADGYHFIWTSLQGDAAYRLSLVRGNIATRDQLLAVIDSLVWP